MILVADNIQITNRIIEKAVGILDPKPVQEMARRCEAAGADAIDINSGPLSRDPEKRMAFLVKAVQDVSDLPILIDSANPKAIEAGLHANRKIAIINGFSLEPMKLEAILPLAKKFDTDIIGYLLNSHGHVPPDGSERLNIAVELYRELQAAGIKKERLIIDPVIVPVIWQNGNIQAREILFVLRHLNELLGFPVRTIAGLSNLTTGKEHWDKKLLLERTYIAMLAASGLTMVLLNIFHYETIKAVRACRSLIAPKVFTWDEIV